jgi:hypothetical protein
MWTKCTIVSEGVADTHNSCIGSSSTSTIEWSKAVSTCKNLTYANHKDWRLPRLPELLTIVDYGKHPAIDALVLSNTQTSLVVDAENVGYWTYTSKLFVDDNYNTTEHARVIFHQGGGVWNLSIAN